MLLALKQSEGSAWENLDLHVVPSIDCTEVRVRVLLIMATPSYGF
jgi:hypothetical protein